ncbi:hypothetical protein [Sediminivirga luteola]|uniref:hypothetical protein n=1 Tax=Sediminivirga luteola TaxID=1774748 RepID=UPI001F55F89D|nr:hypothetical protein [Sediminivirga luteola]MCI2267231.1 hypothetical protein [Sediminivirga luteola]
MAAGSLVLLGTLAGQLVPFAAGLLIAPAAVALITINGRSAPEEEVPDPVETLAERPG